MDKSTLGGIVSAWALVCLAIVLGGAGFGAYIDVPSVIIVVGGTLSVTAGQFEISELKRMSPAIKVAFNEVKTEPLPELVEKVIFYATEVKKHGVMHIEQKVLEEQNPFLKEAFQLIVDGTKPEVLEPMLELKQEHIDKRHNVMISMFGNIGGTAGSMGMIGTLVGLVAMLANLSDPSAVGPAMAVALITTLYGALIGTLFAGVIENKLTRKHDIEMTACEVIISGASMIAAEESIGNIKMKLNSILVEIPE
ncbi:flagellar motor protein MotA [Malaciobacter molluscorum LMG 25693]|uniref:Flagellar motor protein MotA n=1 Tax=Malaciobacter molluscorum LMG 25693 TaxID=870501 RepID=A0A2G1DIT3_9BACT|nr:MotA/TolQ/ExbB proton channel family protein [Malaciobacter molluscorum]AXX93138.1 flagellar motor stator protein [Malaciobacter molluscorum LMG 25693]PHO18397.1 flagellar motor protein MotA [Malaciobacter molluscorum LMG 25693]RXJ95596.1 flagellar motor protein MotA [Malaciobacter molluscorum]